jgi:hypothetical protein
MKESKWLAEITNNPDQDFDLYIELFEGDNSRGRIILDDSRGRLMLDIYPSQQWVRIPLVWLSGIIEQAIKDLGEQSSIDD